MGRVTKRSYSKGEAEKTFKDIVSLKREERKKGLVLKDRTPQKEGDLSQTQDNLLTVMGMNRKEITEIIQGTGCVHPLQGMAELAMMAKESGDMKMAFDCFKELAQYVSPKRKAIEHSVASDDTQPLVIVMPESSYQEIEDDEGN